jgi:hypothetical protein
MNLSPVKPVKNKYGAKSLLKKAARIALAIFNLKLVKLTSFKLTTRELELVKSELETTKKISETLSILSAPVHLSICGSNGFSQNCYPPISQIFISRGEKQPGEALQVCIESIQRCFPSSKHTIYRNEEIIELISKNYESDVLRAYNGIKPYAYKADLARLCILGVKGGWYSDIGVTWTASLEIPDPIDLFVLRDIDLHARTSWACSNAIIYSTSNHPVLEKSIDSIVKNFRNRYYGKTPLCPTGPNVWGQAVASTCDPIKTLFGDVIELTPRHVVKNRAYATDDGKLFAFAKPSEGGDGLEVFGESETNSYNYHWHHNDIYE